jgi:hypothetical protein
MNLKHVSSTQITHTTEKYSLCKHVTLNITTSSSDDKSNVTLSGRQPSLPEGCCPTVVTPDFFELIKDRNPFDGDWNKFWLESHELSNVDWPTLDEERIVWMYHSGHEVFDRAGQIIPLIKRYDYISSPFSNQHCRLKDLVKYLKSHPWTVNPSEIEISNIPSYNSSAAQDRYISVSLRPDRETYSKMYLKARELGPYWSVRLKEMICGYNILFSNDEEDYLGIRPYLKKGV